MCVCVCVHSALPHTQRSWDRLWTHTFSPLLWVPLKCVLNLSSICLSRPYSDILRVGVTLAGHQKKILNSVQMMRAQMNQIQSVEV